MLFISKADAYRNGLSVSTCSLSKWRGNTKLCICICFYTCLINSCIQIIEIIMYMDEGYQHLMGDQIEQFFRIRISSNKGQAVSLSY